MAAKPAGCLDRSVARSIQSELASDVMRPAARRHGCPPIQVMLVMEAPFALDRTIPKTTRPRPPREARLGRRRPVPLRKTAGESWVTSEREPTSTDASTARRTNVLPLLQWSQCQTRHRASESQHVRPNVTRRVCVAALRSALFGRFKVSLPVLPVGATGL